MDLASQERIALATPVKLRVLPNGSHFEVEGEPGALFLKVKHNESRAYVRSLTTRHNVVKTETGEEVEFDSPGGYTNISPETMVVQIEGSSSPGSPTGLRQRRGGKEPHQPLKLCKRGGKRGKVLEKVLSETSIEKACDELGIKRALLLTHMFEIWRDHGVGYEVNGDTIAVETFEGKDPFEESADDLI